MKLTSKHVSAIAGSLIILMILVIFPFIRKMEISHNIRMTIYFVIATIFVYLIYLRFKLKE